MKILLLGFVRIAYMPYMVDYVHLLAAENDVHLVSWNRSGTPDLPCPKGVQKSFVFLDHVEDEDSLASKLPHILRFRKFVIGILKQEQYDKIVVLHSTPGIALLSYLISHYRGSYLLDYRDVSHEEVGVYRWLIRRLSANAGLVLASSPAYLEFLRNKRDVMIKNNLLTTEYKISPRSTRLPIRIRYWGLIRHEAVNRSFIDEFGGDERFELHYHGREERAARNLRQYVVERGYGNIFFHGPYFNDERSSFARDTDIIHNVYENDYATVRAMGNKYYDGIQFKIPQLCSLGSVMGEKVVSKSVGLAVDYSKPGYKEKVFDFFQQIDWREFDRACDEELDSVQEENRQANEEILKFLR